MAPDTEEAATDRSVEEIRIQKLEERMMDMIDIRDIRFYIDDLRHNSQRRSKAGFDTKTADQIADELEELIEDE